MREITLRPLRLSDSPRIQVALNNPRVTRYLADDVPVPYSIEHAVSYYELLTMNEEDGLSVNRAVCENDKLIGLITAIFSAGVRSGSAEIGYWLAESAQKKGYMRNALRSFINNLWIDFPEIIRLYCRIPSPNTASCAAAQAVGFNKEATLSDALCMNGVVMDEQVWACLRKNTAHDCILSD